MTEAVRQDNKVTMWKFSGDRIRSCLLMNLAPLSGCCSLAYEVLYMRFLTTILGDVFYVHATLLSTFLIGIGLGAKLARNWLRWLWVFEIMTGLYALALPHVAQWFSQQVIMTMVTASAALTILTTMVFLVLPSLLIGFSIPLFSAYLKAYNVQRLAFQNIYKVYNFGAMISIIIVELILVRLYGVTLSLGVIGMVNIFSGFTLFLAKVSPASRPEQKPRFFSRRIIIALALASLCSAAFQMFFLKLSYLIFHPHRENFAVALSVIMLGIFIGTWLSGRVRIRFETLLVLIPVVIGLIYVCFVPILKFYEATVYLSRSSELIIFIHKFVFGCIFGLGPMILFGATLPVLMQTESEVAGESGHLICISSLANAGGYLAYVLIGHPFLTSDILLATLAGITLFASLVAVGFFWSKANKILAAAGIILIVLMIFNWQEKYFYLAHWINTLKSDDKVVVFKSGAESATLVHSPEYDWVSYNGHPSIFVRRNQVVNSAEIISGVIPALAAPRLERALVLGLGTGITAGTTANIFAATDVVEINNAFYRMMPSLDYANLEIEHNPAATLYLSDGRAFLIGKRECYDAILNSIPAPTYFSASKIYTVEFYQRVVQALKPDGIFCTWISAPEMSQTGVETVLSALRHNFRYCDLRLMRGSYYMVTCSNQPLRIKRFSELPSRPDLIEQLQRSLSGFDLDEFFEDIRISDNIFKYYNPEIVRENTDDFPVLEFMLVRNFQLQWMGSDPFCQHQHLYNIDFGRPFELKNPARMVHRAAVLDTLAPVFFKQNYLPLLKSTPNTMAEFILWKADHLADKTHPDNIVKLVQDACEVTGYRYQKAVDTLTKTYEAEGRYIEVVAALEKARQSALKSGQTDAAEHFDKQAQYYQSMINKSKQNRP